MPCGRATGSTSKTTSRILTTATSCQRLPLILWFLAEQADKVAEYDYGITAKFVEKYWSAFSQNSLVYIDACDSDQAQDFKQEIFNLTKMRDGRLGWSWKCGESRLRLGTICCKYGAACVRPIARG